MNPRRRLRDRLWLVGLVPAILLLLVSGRAALLLVSQAQAMEAYRAGEYADAASTFAANRTLNPLARWVAPFGEGTALHRDAAYGEAVPALEEALAHAPLEWECAVRTNLALTHEAIGDAHAEEATDPDADATDQDEARDRAEVAWLAGRQALGPCLALVPDPDDPLTDDDRARFSDRDLARRLDPADVTARQAADRRTARTVDDRLADKLTVDELSEPAEADDPGARDETFEERRERLEERDRASLAERRRQEQRNQQREDRPSEPQQPEGPVAEW